jgi:predicted membrane protein
MMHGMERGMGSDKTVARLRVVFGLGVALLGLLLTLDNFGLLEATQLTRYWPVLLIAAGLAKLSHRLRSKARPAGIFLIVLGLILLLVNLGILPFRLALGIFLLVAGAWIVGRAARSTAASPAKLVADPSTHLDDLALLGGIQRALSTQDFRGGNATAVMGGCEIDLSKASIESGEAVINIFAFWGGIDIKVPADWMVESRVVALLGGFSDSARRPDDDRKKLIITGYALMGGVEVHN